VAARPPPRPRSGAEMLIREQRTDVLHETSLLGPAKAKPRSTLAKAIQDGDAHVTIHTAEPGEVRGQIK